VSDDPPFAAGFFKGSATIVRRVILSCVIKPTKARTPYDRLDELRIGDLTTFLAVQRALSISGAARELNVTPSQVSKAISRLESQLQIRLLSRSSRGVVLSEGGRRIVPFVEGAIARLRLIGRAESQTAPELTVAAPSYLATLLLPSIAAALPQHRVRGLELPPALVRAYVAENFFDVALLPSGIERLPTTWVSEQVGRIRKGLFASRALAKRIGSGPVPPERLRSIPFVMPVSNMNGQFVSIDDDCPLVMGERTAGHESQTIGVALELAAATDQLVFGPLVAAQRYLASGALVEVRVLGWDVAEPLFVASNGDRVLSRVQATIVKALRASLAEPDEMHARREPVAAST
jgi:DNA-binding transcriptional LysR family regulator